MWFNQLQQVALQVWRCESMLELIYRRRLLTHPGYPLDQNDLRWSKRSQPSYFHHDEVAGSLVCFTTS